MTLSRTKARLAALESRVKARPSHAPWVATSCPHQAARQYMALLDEGRAQSSSDAWQHLEPAETELTYREVMA